jgi:hypothetical protein
MQKSPEQQGILISVDDVRIEAYPASRDDLLWFYVSVTKLRYVEPPTEIPDHHELRFRSDQHDLLISLSDAPRIEPVACRVIVAVPSLEEAIASLEERRIEFLRLHGIGGARQYLSLLDPAGNRLEIRHITPALFY